MTRHIADSRADGSLARTRRFAEAARRQGEEGSHPAAKAVAARPQNRQPGRRMVEFARIARGRTA